MRCSRCRATYFCGPDCQRRSWKQHKAFCISFKISAPKEEHLAEAQAPDCGSSESTAESDMSDPCSFDELVSSNSFGGSAHTYRHEETDTSSIEVDAKTVEACTNAMIAITQRISVEPQAKEINDVNDIWEEAYWENAYNWGKSNATTTVISAEGQANGIKDISDANADAPASAQSATQEIQTSTDDGCCIPLAKTFTAFRRLSTRYG